MAWMLDVHLYFTASFLVGVSTDYGGGCYVLSAAPLLHWCSVPPPSVASTCFFYLCLCNACVSCPKSRGETHINI